MRARESERERTAADECCGVLEQFLEWRMFRKCEFLRIRMLHHTIETHPPPDGPTSERQKGGGPTGNTDTGGAASCLPFPLGTQQLGLETPPSPQSPSVSPSAFLPASLSPSVIPP